jgi:hypothetical protein
MFIAAPALAEVRIRSSLGGPVDEYLKLFSRVRQTGERVVIDGPCLSACTLVLSTIPNNRICVTSRAVLGFHAPRWVDVKTGRTFPARKETRAVTASYPSAVRSWLKRQGGLSAKVLYLRGRALTRLYRRC